MAPFASTHKPDMADINKLISEPGFDATKHMLGQDFYFNWIPVYVICSLVPVFFAISAVISVWLDRRQLAALREKQARLLPLHARRWGAGAAAQERMWRREADNSVTDGAHKMTTAVAAAGADAAGAGAGPSRRPSLALPPRKDMPGTGVPRTRQEEQAGLSGSKSNTSRVRDGGGRDRPPGAGKELPRLPPPNAGSATARAAKSAVE